MNRVTMSYITILLETPDQRGDINEMAAKVRAITRDYAFARPRINFPNAAGRPRLLFADPRHAARAGHEEAGGDRRKRSASSSCRANSVADVKANLNLNNPELQVAIDRPLASDLGVRVSDIAGAVRLLMSGEDEISTYKEGSEQYPVPCG